MKLKLFYRFLFYLIFFFLRQALEGQKIICFSFESKALMYSDINRNADRTSKLKLTDLYFLTSGKNFYFERASPFVEKFDKILLTLLESGISELYLRNLTSRNLSPKKNNEVKDEDHILLKELIVILVFGYLISAFVFYCELLYCSYEVKRKNYIN